MRTPIIAGNWKMNKTIAEAKAFADAVVEPLAEFTNVEQGICAPFIQLSTLQAAFTGSTVKLGAQNVYWEDSGAYTGETSPLMLKGVVDLVIIGHSERRQYFGETDETVNKKIKACLTHGLTPIVAIGETLAQNEAGETEAVLERQAWAAFEDITAEQAKGIIVAYEPIWAIGTGKSATPEDANRIIGEAVRGTLTKIYDAATAQQIRIQYGGSMKEANCEALMSQPEIDGGLVGGASLKPESFISLISMISAIYR